VEGVAHLMARLAISWMGREVQQSPSLASGGAMTVKGWMHEPSTPESGSVMTKVEFGANPDDPRIASHLEGLRAGLEEIVRERL
jgi:hypothetical protein